MSVTRLIVARHGNTFEDNETPRRVGVKTDLPLVMKGRQQATAIGRYLKASGMVPDMVFCSRLQRTMETAFVAMKEAGRTAAATPLEIFDEISYGPDENRTDADVVARIGQQALADWEEKSLVPDGWKADPARIAENWKVFAQNILEEYAGDNILAVTSNGIARFAPHITDDYDTFRVQHSPKIATGALCIFECGEEGDWKLVSWNVKPPL